MYYKLQDHLPFPFNFLLSQDFRLWQPSTYLVAHKLAHLAKESTQTVLQVNSPIRSYFTFITDVTQFLEDFQEDVNTFESNLTSEENLCQLASNGISQLKPVVLYTGGGDSNCHCIPCFETGLQESLPCIETSLPCWPYILQKRILVTIPKVFVNSNNKLLLCSVKYIQIKAFYYICSHKGKTLAVQAARNLVIL